MTSILRQYTKATGETVTVSTVGAAGEPAASALVEVSVEERDAVDAAFRAFDEGRLDDLRELLAPFADAALLPATLVTLARACIADGDFETADQWLMRAEARFPQEPQVWKALAILRRLQQRSADELRYRRNLILLVPKAAPGAHLAFAQAFAKAYEKDKDPPFGEIRFISDKLANAPLLDDSARQERLEFAQHLYAFKPLQPEAIRHYAAVSPCPPEARDVSVAWLPMHQWCDRIAIDCLRSTEHGRPGRRPMLAELGRVAVLPTMQWAPVLDETNVAIDGFLMHRIKLQSEEPASPIFLNRPGHRAELRLPRELPLVDRPALLLGGMAQYYHNTVDFLSTLAVAELFEAPTDLALVVNDDLAPFQLEQMALLGIDPARLLRVPASQPVRFAQLWVPSRLVVTGTWMDPLLPQWYRRRLVSPQAQPGRKLYLSRGATGRRRVANEQAVIDLLRPLGYEVVRPEQLSVAQQVELFAQASHIIGPTGAAMTNMIYAAPGAEVTVFYSRYMVAGGAALYFDALAKACGHGFGKIDCKPVHVHTVDRAIDADITVDLEQLRAALD